LRGFYREKERVSANANSIGKTPSGKSTMVLSGGSKGNSKTGGKD